METLDGLPSILEDTELLGTTQPLLLMVLHVYITKVRPTPKF